MYMRHRDTVTGKNLSLSHVLQYLTLVFIGGISISSLRGFLKNMSKVHPFQEEPLQSVGEGYPQQLRPGVEVGPKTER